MTRSSHIYAIGPLAFLLLGYASAPAQLIFDDGQEHVLTGIVEQEVIVSNRSTLDIQNANLWPLSVNNATVELNDGSIGGGCCSPDDRVVFLLNGADFTVNDGSLGGIEATGSHVVVNGGNVSSGEPTAIGIDAFGSSTITIHDGSVIGDAWGVVLNDRSTLMIDGGSVGWGGVQASDESAVEMSGGSLGDGGFHLGGNSRLEVTGGSVRSRFACVLGCPNIGIYAADKADAIVQNLSFDLAARGVFLTRYAWARDDADVKVVDSQGTAADVEQTFRSDGNAKLLVRNGQFQSTNDWSERDPEEPSMFAAAGTSQLHVDQGFYELSVNSTGDSTWSLFAASADAGLRMDAGSFRLNYSEDSRATTAVGVLAEDESRTEIYGGHFAFDVGDSTTWHLDVRDDATVMLFGSGFNFPLFESLQPATGAITGTLTDGSRINWAFRRDNTATIVLLPEPGAILMLAIGLGTLACKSKH